MPEVFISYSHDDKKHANKVISILNHFGISYFIDEKNIDYGETITKKVKEGIENCNIFLI